LYSRRLLGDSGAEETRDSCPGGGSQLFRASSDSGQIIVSDAVVCAAGTSTLVFDIGYIGSDGSFIPATLSAMSVIVIVAPGKSVAMRLFSTNSTRELSFARLATYVYMRFLDRGRNVRLFAAA
jgi:hypothetical protein